MERFALMYTAIDNRNWQLFLIPDPKLEIAADITFFECSQLNEHPVVGLDPYSSGLTDFI